MKENLFFLLYRSIYKYLQKKYVQICPLDLSQLIETLHDTGALHPLASLGTSPGSTSTLFVGGPAQ